MKNAIEETARRRELQEKYNTEHGIVPATVIRAVMNINPAAGTTDYYEVPKIPKAGAKGAKGESVDLSEQLRALRTEMFQAAENLEFERAAKLRDELKKLEALAGKNGAAAAASPSPDALYDPYAGSPKKTRGGGRGKTGAAKSSAKASSGSRGRFKR